MRMYYLLIIYAMLTLADKCDDSSTEMELLFRKGAARIFWRGRDWVAPAGLVTDPGGFYIYILFLWILSIVFPQPRRFRSLTRCLHVCVFYCPVDVKLQGGLMCRFRGWLSRPTWAGCPRLAVPCCLRVWGGRSFFWILHPLPQERPPGPFRDRLAVVRRFAPILTVETTLGWVGDAPLGALRAAKRKNAPVCPLAEVAKVTLPDLLTVKPLQVSAPFCFGRCADVGSGRRAKRQATHKPKAR